MKEFLMRPKIDVAFKEIMEDEKRVPDFFQLY